jgi:bifunctional NMN adenylyltransferase/nudix hydrolase
MFDYGFFVGRFEPVHKGHLKLIIESLQHVETTIVFIGSASTERTKKNPFLVSERIQLITDSLGDLANRVIFAEVADYSTDEEWKLDIDKQLAKITCGKKTVILGYYKDASSYYLKMFPEYEQFITQEPYCDGISSTTIREMYFLNNCIDDIHLTESTIAFLKKFIDTSYFSHIRSLYLE